MRKCASVLLLALVVAWGSWVGAEIDPVYSIETENHVIYGKMYYEGGSTRELIAAIHKPAESTATNKPVLICLHGNPGASSYPDNRQFSFLRQRDYFTKRGFVVMVPAWSLDGLITEIKCAVRYIRANAAAYGIDSEKIAVYGHSYGAAWTFTLATDDTGIGALNEQEIADPLNNAGVPDHVAVGIAEAGVIFNESELDEDDEPVLVVHGTNDEVVDFVNGIEAHALLEATRIPQGFLVHDGGHSIDLSGTHNFGMTFEELQAQWIYVHMLPEAADTYPMTEIAEGPGTIVLDDEIGFYPPGHTVQATAQPDGGAQFLYWTGEFASLSPTLNVTMNSAKTLTAVFAGTGPSDTYSLSVSFEGGGTAHLDPPGGIYPPGVEVTITAQPAPGWGLATWSGDASGASSSVAVTMDGDKLVTAQFDDLGLPVPVGKTLALVCISAALLAAGLYVLRSAYARSRQSTRTS